MAFSARRVPSKCYIALGGGVYWGTTSATIIAFGADKVASSSPLMLAFHGLATALFVIVFALCSRFFIRSGVQRAYAAAGVLATVIVAVDYVVPFLASWLGILISAFSRGFFICYWGLSYATLDKRDAERAVLVSLLIGALVYASLAFLPVGRLREGLICILQIASVVPLLARCQTLAIINRTRPTAVVFSMVPFYILRVLFGFCIAFLMFAPTVAPGGGIRPSFVGAIMDILFVAVVALCILKGWLDRASCVRIAPIVVVGLIALPAAVSWSEVGAGMCRFLGIVVWLAWIVLSSSQLSDLKEHVGLNEAELSFSEKAVLVCSVCVGEWMLYGACLASPQLGDFIQANMAQIGIALTFICVVVSCYQLSRFIDQKEHYRLAKQAVHYSQNQLRLACERLAQEYGLTKRECDVAELMARGHARPYICKALFVSEGTVRSHANNVYRKLGIHSREELFEIVQAGVETEAFSVMGADG